MDLFSMHHPEDVEIEESAYYWWYRFLQKVDGYGPSHPLWDEFGDVTQDFWDWWIAVERIFMTGLPPGVVTLESDAEIEEARKEGALIVRVDPKCTRHYLRFSFEDFMKEEDITDSPGRKKHEQEILMAQRGFATRPEVRGLEKCWRVHELRTSEPNLSLYEIGIRLNLNPNAVVKKGMLKKERADKINVMNATVGRYWRNALSIIEHVGKGKFPVLAGRKASNLRGPETG